MKFDIQIILAWILLFIIPVGIVVILHNIENKNKQESYEEIINNCK